jgi:osmotically-inducible protein OsmY
MLDTDLIDRVVHELYWDPSVDEAAIAVSAENGVVVVRGTVGGVRERRWVEDAVKRVPGLRFVENRLHVRPLTRRGRSDARIRGRVIQALVLSAVVPSTVDAYVRTGFVTLTGTALRQFVRDEAERIVLSVERVTGVMDEIVLEEPEPTADEIAQQIGDVLARLAETEARDLDVTVLDGKVELAGVVGSPARRDQAIAAAEAVPGVTEVADRIRVEPAP